MSAVVHGNDLWITSFFPAATVEGFYWYVYRVVGNDIVGAASIAGDEEVGVYSPIAVSDTGVVAIVWSGTGSPSSVNFGILPYVTGR